MGTDTYLVANSLSPRHCDEVTQDNEGVAGGTLMGSEINKRRALPNLQGVTGSPLRILGMIWLEIGVREDHIHKQWFPVLPNSYLDADLLLGPDVLSRAPFTWNGNKNTIVWRNTSYVINHIRRQRGKVERVRATPLALNHSDQVKDIRLTKSIRIEPYQTQFLPILVPENPGETLLVHSQPKINPDSLPFLTKVDDSSNIYLPFINNTKGVKKVKQGTLLGIFESLSFETVSAIQAPSECPPLEIHNNLLPKNDEVQTKENCSRAERFTELIRQQKWNHLTREQKAELKSAILDNHELFILDKSELRLMKGPPAKINVADPQPSRGPKYRYPEEAKRLIAEMLQDMEDRQIIEKSTSAWLSPIVLVNKPDGSKRMCLDYRHVNKHLAPDI